MEDGISKGRFRGTRGVSRLELNDVDNRYFGGICVSNVHAYDEREDDVLDGIVGKNERLLVNKGT